MDKLGQVKAEAFIRFSDRLKPGMDEMARIHDHILTHTRRLNIVLPLCKQIMAPLDLEWRLYVLELLDIVGSLARDLDGIGNASVMFGEAIVELANEAMENANE
jgi:hypothetical protein